MRRPPAYLTSQQLQAHALGFLLPVLQFVAYKRLCTPALLLRILLCAAAWQRSLAAVCRLLRGAPSDQTVRDALRDQLADHRALEQRLNRGLALTARQLRRRKKGYPLAVDLTYLPYYGRDHEAPQVVTNKARQGTKRFQAFATA
jgi:putative transposase